MNILLSGLPHSGKTTAMDSFLRTVNYKQGFITRELLEHDQRIGFQLVSSLGSTATLASVKSASPLSVSRYGVNLTEFDDFLAGLPEIDPKNLLYIDEIGQMELYSQRFKNLVLEYLAAGNSFLGTITSVYHDDFTNQIRSRDDINFIELTLDNRMEIANELPLLFT